MNKKYLAFWVVVLLQILILSWIIAKYSYVLITWTEIQVKTIPVDPRDIFRGDYVTLSYDINTYSISWDQNYSNNENLFVVPKMEGNKVTWIESITKESPIWLYFKAKVESINSIANMQIKVYWTWWWFEIKEYTKTYYSDYLNFWEWDKLKVYLTKTGSINYIYKDYNQVNQKKIDTFTDTYRAGEIIKIQKIAKQIILDYNANRFFIKEWTWKEIEKQIRENTVYAVWKVSKSWKIVVSDLSFEDKEEN